MAARKQLAPPTRDREVSTYVRKEKRSGEQPTPLPSPPIRGEEGEGVLPQAGNGGVIGEIKNLAKQLDPALRRQLLAELSLQATELDGAEHRDLDMWAAAVYKGLVAANGGSAGSVPGPAIVKRALGSGGAWSIVRGFMADSKLDALKHIERQRVYELLAELVIANARHISRRSNAPLSPKLVGSCSSNIASLFDHAFPGYVRAGLAPLVAKRLTQPAFV